ncbi:UDP-2,3-diacylglucosamine diphosphatase [Owenweeksia hongkongensis]|uniref:UDP-2,3-diacylglucosamine diphosphatase n=1 Tax=Owenweeksia hongkongensis TaxID=253245 RepID=UPI003A918022
MQLENGKKIYFASDLHLGAPNYEESLKRERHFVKWLEEIRHDAAEIFIVGDLFDFWFEYKKAVPRGFVRVLGKLAEIVDSGISVHMFTGNHDMWIFDYLPQEIGVTLYRKPIEREWDGKKFLIGHGDGLGPGDHGYKFIKKVFSNPFLQWSFARLHPNFGIGLADYFSKKSRAKTGDDDAVFLGEENEWLVIYCKEVLKKEHFDYFIFGHRHLPLNIELKPDSHYINLGDWIQYFTYGEFDGETMELKDYPFPKN